jgi:ureidoacrylate peracid hydrolase
MAEFMIDPSHAALLTIDLQNLFVEGQFAAYDGLATLERVNSLAAECRALQMLVIHTRHALRPDGSNMGILGELSAAVRAGILSDIGEPTALHPALIVDPRDLLVDKPRYGAFHGTDLELILRNKRIDTVVIAGIATNICCDTTAREAVARDFRVFFLSDGTATGETAGLPPSSVQAATLATIADAFGWVLSTEQAIAAIAAGVRSGTSGDGGPTLQSISATA